MFKTMIVAGFGGFIGTCCRFLMNKAFPITPYQFPLSTFLVNIIGCFIFGIIIGYFERYKLVSPSLYAMIITGFCGGLTTFSTFSYELNNLIVRSEFLIFSLYLILSILLGLFFLWIGLNLFR